MTITTTPTLVSSRQPCHSAVSVPGRSASHTAPSIAAAATTNQIRMRSVVIAGYRAAPSRVTA